MVSVIFQNKGEGAFSKNHPKFLIVRFFMVEVGFYQYRFWVSWWYFLNDRDFLSRFFIFVGVHFYQFRTRTFFSDDFWRSRSSPFSLELFYHEQETLSFLPFELFKDQPQNHFLPKINTPPTPLHPIPTPLNYITNSLTLYNN